MKCNRTVFVLVAILTAAVVTPARSEEILPPITERFARGNTDETPSFQRHVVNLFGQLGCNGRACHGSFQGRGGFQLSLFGYDFKADHDALFDKDSPRVDVENVDASLIISKPTDADFHEGGQRYEIGSWQYHVLRRWIEAGARREEQTQKLEQLRIVPAEILFAKPDQDVQLQAIAVWEDGTQEDVTPLCRFNTNDSQVAKIDDNGLVTAGESGDTHVVVSYDNGVVPVPVIRPVSNQAGKNYPTVDTPTKVDELVVQKLRKLGIVPSEASSDTEFLRRVRLDMTGTLPTPEEVESFLADDSKNKRSKKIDELLETDQYVAWWTTKLCDFTGNNEDQLNNVNPMRGSASREWYDWIYKRVQENTPYDELASGIVTAVSRKPDQSYREYCEQMSELYRPDAEQSFADLPSMTHYWARQDFREVDARVIAFAYSFMGLRIQCAQCHKHPFDQWSKDDFDEFKNFFAGVSGGRYGITPDARKEYAVLLEELGLKGKRGNDARREYPKLLKAGKTIPFTEVVVAKPRTNSRNATPEASTARLLGGATIDLTKCDDPRQEVMDWLRDKDNRFFATAFVNRVWASYFNVGIVNPPDDLSLANPPSNRPLLEYLAGGFVDSGFDMKWLHREIANSRTYQTSWRPNETNQLDEKNFSRAVPRRIPAEVLYDAIRQATSSDEQVVAINRDVRERAIAIPGAGQRGIRNSSAGYALTIFGRSTRDSNCDCDRSAEASLLQTVYLQNDQEVLRLVGLRKDGWVEQVVQEVRLQRPVASGTPTASEKQVRQLKFQIAAGEKRLGKLRASGDDAAVKKLEPRLAQAKRRLATLDRTASTSHESKPSASKVSKADVEAIIEKAFLRTVSRHPTEAELASSQIYLNDSENPVQGLQDLLWALLNTKEFQINH